MDKLLFKKILVAALTVLAIIYVSYLLISANFDMYPTENAVQTTISDKIIANGFIVRDETLLKNNTSGVLSYTCSEGEQIEKDGEIAKIYSSNDDALAQTYADMLEEKVNSLKNIQKNHSANAVGIDTINNNIKNNIINYISNINNGEVRSVSQDFLNLVDSINQRLIYTGKTNNFNAEINELNAEISKLRNSSSDSIGTITTDKAGNFSAYCDGYEESIKYSAIDKITLKDLRNIKKSNVSDNTAGKIISSLSWYVVCEVPADKATELNHWDSDVTVLFSDASSEKVPAKIYRIHQDSKEENALVILRCDYMTASLSATRQEPIEIGLGTYTGLRISKRAIHDDYVTKTTYDDNDKAKTEKKKVQGVYVLYGSEIQFKQISIMYANDDYVICNPTPEDGELFNGKTISLYDQVIVKGDDLYDGKVIH